MSAPLSPPAASQSILREHPQAHSAFPASPQAKGGLSVWFQGIHQAPAFLPWGIPQELNWLLCETAHPLTFQLPQSRNLPAGTVGNENFHMQEAILDSKELSSLEGKCLYSC